VGKVVMAAALIIYTEMAAAFDSGIGLWQGAPHSRIRHDFDLAGLFAHNYLKPACLAG